MHKIFYLVFITEQKMTAIAKLHNIFMNNHIEILTTPSICNTCNLQLVIFATHAICNTCNLHHIKFADGKFETSAICHTCMTNQLDGSAKRTSWKVQLDRPAE